MRESQPSPPSQVIKRALLSVSDKRGLVSLARALREMGVEIIATGGTAEVLYEAKIPLREVSDVTEFPELMNGRLKTLHPRIHGGLLAQRDNPDHREAMSEHGIENIDLLVVNLYPFEETLQRTNDEAELIENTDIGGPAMIRAAAKNHAHVCVLTSPKEYHYLLDEMRKYNGATSDILRLYLASLAFHRTSCYDAVISKWMKETTYSYISKRKRKAIYSYDKADLDSQKDFFKFGSDLQKVSFKDVNLGEDKLEGVTRLCIGAGPPYDEVDLTFQKSSSNYFLRFSNDLQGISFENACLGKDKLKETTRSYVEVAPIARKNFSDDSKVLIGVGDSQGYVNAEKNEWTEEWLWLWFGMSAVGEKEVSCSFDHLPEIDNVKEDLGNVVTEKNG